MLVTVTLSNVVTPTFHSRYGGSNHLCDMYCSGRLEGEADDVRLRVDGPMTDLRSVETEDRERDNLSINQDVVSERCWCHVTSSCQSGRGG